MPTYPLTGFNGSELTPVPGDKLRAAHIALVTAIGFAVPHRVVYIPDAADWEGWRDHWLQLAKSETDYVAGFLDEVGPHSPEVFTPEICEEIRNAFIDAYDTMFRALERARDRSMQVDPLTGEPV